MEEYANKLPIELINKIINYTNVVAFRNGKYINRIPKTDARYAMLRNLVKPVKLGKRVLINLINYYLFKKILLIYSCIVESYAEFLYFTVRVSTADYLIIKLLTKSCCALCI